MSSGGNSDPSPPQDAAVHRRWRPNPKLMAQHLGEEMVIVHLGTDRIYSLNPSAARIWDLLGDGCDEMEIQQQLRREFAVDDAQLSQEIEAILASFVAEQLVVIDANV